MTTDQGSFNGGTFGTTKAQIAIAIIDDILFGANAPNIYYRLDLPGVSDSILN